MGHALNSDHKVQYFSGPTAEGVLKEARHFVKSDDAGSFNTLQVQVEWDDEADALKYVGYLIHGGW